MTTITFQCYCCNQTLKIGAERAGQKAQCGSCSTILNVPPLDQHSIPAGIPTTQPGSQPCDPLDFSDTIIRETDLPTKRLDYDAAPTLSSAFDVPFPKQHRDDDDNDEEYEYSSRRKRRGERGSWKLMRVGFFVGFIGLLVHLGLFALEQIGVVILTVVSFTSSGGYDAFMACGVICRIAVGFGFLAFIALYVGTVFWLFGKNRYGSLAWAIATVAVGGTALIWSLALDVPSVFYSSPSFVFAGRNFSGVLSHLDFFSKQNYGPFAALSGFRDALAGFRPTNEVVKPVGTVILEIITQLLVHAFLMMTAFYVWTMGKIFRDRSLRQRGILLIVFLSISAGIQLIWPLIIRAFVASTATGGNNLMQSWGVSLRVCGWIFYWLGVALIATVYIIIIATFRRMMLEIDSVSKGEIDKRYD